MSDIVKRKKIRFYPDSSRVIARFFMHGDKERTINLVKKILSLSELQRQRLLNRTLVDYSQRHRNISKILEKNYQKIECFLKEMDVDENTLSLQTKLLIGSYFTMEYAIEAAAFFNPSMVEAPDQTCLAPGEKRVILSFRATGEGHISSIVFRSGILNKDNEIKVKPAGELVDVPEAVKRYLYEKEAFLNKLREMNIEKDIIGMVMDRLGDNFVYGELKASIDDVVKNRDLTYTRKKVVQAINWLASSHYEITFSLDTALSERVIFPVSYTESNGIEDARFVRFVNKDGSATYYCTYTAYNGYAILPKLIETKDFYHFNISPLHGEVAQNKGMALFPRKINGRYYMVSRVDGVNNYIMSSEDINVWNEATKLAEPENYWEFVQVGNCGSPVETEHGWLLITHGVGPMRTYSIGVCLLDLNDPSKVIARLPEPLMVPNEEEREGYVPNVVYSCGVIINNEELVIPYAMSDYSSSVATVPLDLLFKKLLG